MGNHQSEEENQVNTHSQLIGMGFNEQISTYYSHKYGNNVEKAVDAILDDQEKKKQKIEEQIGKGLMKIHIQTITGKKADLILKKNATLKALCMKIHEKLQIPPWYAYRLVLCGKKIDNEWWQNVELSTPLSTLGITENVSSCTYNLLFRLGYFTDPVTILKLEKQWYFNCGKSYNKSIKATTCPFMSDDHDIHNICPVYSRLKNYRYSQDDLEHMQLYTHCKIKTINCKYGINCSAYQRLISNENRLDDLCHNQIYDHPPRRRQSMPVKPLDCHSFLFTQETEECKSSIQHGLCMCQQSHKYHQHYLENAPNYSSDDELLKLLIKEVKKNGFKKDLYLNDGTSLVKVAEKKFFHKRHVAMGQPLNKAYMLSILLYTGCDCNYDLSKEQRNGNYDKWHVFDWCLNEAILLLWKHEYSSFPLYSGLGNVMFDFNDVRFPSYGYLSTFMSTSWDINVAKTFLRENGDKGMLIGIESRVCDMWYRYKPIIVCADISWISKFPNEKEVLIARRHPGGMTTFYPAFAKEIDGMQMVKFKDCKNGRDEKLF
eukprot:537291_1